MNRPQQGPVTLALTTEPANHLDDAATRPGRLAPLLELGLPSADERRVLLERAIADIPTLGPIDLEPVVERSVGWTGAELAGAIEAACSRSLVLDGAEAGLRQELLMAIVAERYVIEDARPFPGDLLEAVAQHEAAHAIYAELTLPGSVALIEITPRGGHTALSDELERRYHTGAELRALAGVDLAGIAIESLLYGTDGLLGGSERDRINATERLRALVALHRPWADDTFESDGPCQGSERMRAATHAAVESLAGEVYAEVTARMSQQLGAVRVLADRLLAARDQSLSGDEARAALRLALTADAGGPKSAISGN